MKKVIKKTEKETTLDMLARMMLGGFEEIKNDMNNRFEKMEGRLTQEISSVKQEISSVKEEMNIRFEDVEIRLTNINLEQKETNRRLDTMERHQKGMLESLDETVHRNEFNKVVRRVEVLEKR